jgi:2-polyprenyl-3-methyl-5-hydroxy-6-metoxy-1,4-benzoquinol methylase
MCETDEFSRVQHDWCSQAYVDEWISRDFQKDAERRPRLAYMFTAVSIPESAVSTVLDVGGGFGVVTEELLRVFPRAQVTLQDFSEPMLGHARSRLSRYGAQVKYILADLRDPLWADRVGGPFDLIVSGWAIHNLADPTAIGACYGKIAGLLKPGCSFLDYDLFDHVGGVELHIQLLQDARFVRPDCIWHEAPSAIILART